jgi:hypothetical protein
MQTWVDKCGREMPGAGAKECNIPCNDNKVVRGDPNCPDKAWTECPKTCLQTRKIPPKKRRLRRLGKVSPQDPLQAHSTLLHIDSICVS